MTKAHNVDPHAEPLALTLGDLNDAAVRSEHSSAAFSIFHKLANAWNLSVGERLDLLGGITRQTYHNWETGKVSPKLSRDQLERISLALGVEKGLKTFFADAARGQAWLKAPNRELAFGGRAPLDVMCADGMNGMRVVRRYIDHARGVK